MLSLICLVAALVCFFIAAINVATPRVNLIALGLFFWVLSLLVGHVGVR